MIHRTELYGLLIESDVPLRGVVDADRTRAADVRVYFATRPPPSSRWEAASAHVFFRSESFSDEPPALVADRPRDGNMLRLTYAEGIRFHILDDGSAVWCDWDAPLTEADALTFLLGPVLGLVLRRRGVLALHASAVVHEGAAWAFVGPGGAGKSTLAAAFATAGWPVLTDDVLALTPRDGRWLVWPAYDHLRLWDDSPALAGGGARDLPALTPTWEKRALALDDSGLASARAAVPLAGWFLLGEREDVPSPAAADPRLEPLAGAAALRALIRNSYVNYLLDNRARAQELSALGRAAQGLRSWRLVVGEGEAGLSATVRAVSLATASTNDPR